MPTKETLLTLKGQGTPVDHTTLSDIERQLYKEARLLDSEDMHQWCDMLAEDLVYWMPIRENHMRKYRQPELAVNRCALYDETKEFILVRLRRNDSGMCWTEDPPTRHVYAISNIEVFETVGPDEFEVHSVFTLYRSRFERDDSTLMGRRTDIWRRTESGFLLAGRLILLQQSTLLVKNLNVFF